MERMTADRLPKHIEGFDTYIDKNGWVGYTRSPDGPRFSYLIDEIGVLPKECWMPTKPKDNESKEGIQDYQQG